jgi:transposase
MDRCQAVASRLTRRVRRELRFLARSGGCEFRLVQRARIVLLVAKGVGIAATARRVGATEPTVRTWCDRFIAEPSSEGISDRPRAGRPATVPLTLRCELVKLACTKPDPDKPPFRNVWTLNSLRDALLATAGQTLSRSEIHRILNAEEIPPHRIHYWLHSPDPDFRVKVNRICGLYTHLPKDATLVCVDEKTCMQALARKRPVVPATAGKAGRLDFEYRRKGTTNLLAAFEPRTGKVFGVCRKTRKAEDLLAFMEAVARRYPVGPVYVVWDNLNIHHGERWEEFNARHGGRFHFIYTPIHASWLNQVEVWFGIVQRRILRFGHFESVEQLVKRVQSFIRYWNRREAHPFRWTFRGYTRKIGARRAA